MRTRKRIWRYLLYGLLLSGAVGCGKPSPESATAASTSSNARSRSPQRKVLVVHSYHPEYDWTAAVNRGIQMALPTRRVQIETFYMDTKRKTALEWKQQIGLEALAVIDEWQPEVVITVDDNAQEYVGRYLADRSRPAVVFCGVNAAVEKYGYPAVNVTGVCEVPHFSKTLELACRLVPEARRVLVLSDRSPTSEGALAYMKQQATAGLEVIGWQMPETLSQWKQTVEQVQQTADLLAVYTYHTVQSDQPGEQSVPAKEVMDWTIEHSGIPVVGFLSFAVNDGSLCGVLESGAEQGQLAGELTSKILSGHRPEMLLYLQNKQGQSMVNLEAADQLGIEIAPEISAGVDLLIYRSFEGQL